MIPDRGGAVVRIHMPGHECGMCHCLSAFTGEKKWNWAACRAYRGRGKEMRVLQDSKPSEAEFLLAHVSNMVFVPRCYSLARFEK
jgi:hypothetical protein